MMRTAIAACLVLVLTGMALAQGPSRFEDIRRIDDRGKLIVAMIAHDVPPIIATDGAGNPAGFDGKLARTIADLMGVEIEFDRSADTYDGVVALVADGRADIAVSFLSRTVARSRLVLFSRPYLRQDLSVLINRIRALEYRDRCPAWDDFAGLARRPGQVGVQEGSAYAKELARVVPDGKPTVFETSQDAWEAVYKGDVTTSFQGELAVKAFLRRHPAYHIKVRLCHLDQEPPDKIVIAVRPDAPNLLRLIDNILGNIEMPLTVDQLLAHEGSLIRQPDKR